MLYEANIDVKFLFVHRCGLYHRLIRAFSQVFCFVEGNTTRVGPQTAFAGGALIPVTNTFFFTSPLVCALQVHVTESQ